MFVHQAVPVATSLARTSGLQNPSFTTYKVHSINYTFVRQFENRLSPSSISFFLNILYQSFKKVIQRNGPSANSLTMLWKEKPDNFT
ncbi:hypothetical protein RB195_015599 [Necator americanus]|uniref:Uncharacterized protein n=1 Tax=Necator americanus TaxID=51031 RepID=A0ABR1E5G8_NECAM